MPFEPRIRRLELAIEGIKALPADESAGIDVESHLQNALGAIYDLTESFWGEAAPTRLQGTATQDSRVQGDPAGEIVAALAFARGEVSHGLLELSEGSVFGDFNFGEGRFGGDWKWKQLTPRTDRLRLRQEWYAEHIAGQLWSKSLVVAQGWFITQHDQGAL